MTRRLTKNLRKGHLAEDVGISFLRNFCAVAQVRQEDDLGIDAICTLLKPHKKFLIAEETFMVQIKSKSVREIEYTGDEIDWLLEQDLPLFILSVDFKNGDIELFTTNPIFGLIVKNVDSANLKLDLKGGLLIHDRIQVDEKHAEIAIGPPILKTSELKAREDSNSEEIYKLIKTWVSNEINQIGFRKLKKARLAEWETWEEPKYRGGVSTGSSSNVQNDMSIIAPYIEYLSMHVFWDQDDHQAASAFVDLQKWFEDNDVDLDVDVDDLKSKIPKNH